MFVRLVVSLLLWAVVPVVVVVLDVVTCPKAALVCNLT